MNLASLFDVRGLKVVLTGAGGVLVGAMAEALAGLGAQVAVLDQATEKAERVAGRITAAGGQALALACDVTDPPTIQQAFETIMEKWGQVDRLVNGAGGNHPRASTSKETTFFDLAPEAIRHTLDLNFLGTLFPCQVFGRQMAQQGRGAIVNIASMNSIRPLTRIPAYSAGKAAVANFTQWLAVYMAQEHSPAIRVNAIAPGFFVTEQTRFLHIDPQTGGYTERGQKILAHTPLGRMGQPEDLLGTLIWLLSPASAFVTGVVVPVDGGVSAYSGV